MVRSGVGGLVTVLVVPLLLVSAMCFSISARRSCRSLAVADDILLEVRE